MANKMISRESLGVGIIAILAGIGAAYAMRVYLTQEEPPPAAKPAPPKILTVPVASSDLPANRVINPGDVFILKITGKQFTERFKGINPDLVMVMGSAAQIGRRRLKVPIKQGQPFLTTDFYLEGQNQGVAAKLQPGYRAIRVEVPETHEGGIQTGAFVDVFFRAKPQKAEHGQPAIPEMTTTLMRHVEVLRMDFPQPRGGGPKGEPKVATDKKSVVVTLAVPEDKANIFGIVDGKGELWITPTPATTPPTADKPGAATPTPTTLAGLLGIKPSPRPVKVLPFETAIYRGNRPPQVNRFVDGKLVMSRIIEHTPTAGQGQGRRAEEPQSLPPESPGGE